MTGLSIEIGVDETGRQAIVEGRSRLLDETCCGLELRMNQRDARRWYQ